MKTFSDPQQVADAISLLKDKLRGVNLSDPDVLRKVGAVLIAIGSSPKIRSGETQFGKGIESLIFSAMYGVFLGSWATFDLMVEIAIMRQLNLQPLENSIVCAGVSFGAKIQILYSLLTRNEGTCDNEGVALLKKTQELAARNSFAHGFLDYDSKNFQSLLVTREVKNEYFVKIKKLDYKIMLAHLLDFLLKLSEIAEHFKISVDDLATYRKSIQDHAQDHASRASRRRESLTSSQSAKRKRRAPRAS